jgi:DNA-binding NarL/FixJ family response regulator
MTTPWSGGITALIKKSGTCRVVGEAGTARAALQLLPTVGLNVVLLDLGLLDDKGSAVIRGLDRCLPQGELLVLTAYEKVGMATKRYELELVAASSTTWPARNR